MEQNEGCSWHSRPLWMPWLLARTMATFPLEIALRSPGPAWASEAAWLSDHVRFASVSMMRRPLTLLLRITTLAARISTSLGQLMILASMVTVEVIVQEPV